VVVLVAAQEDGPFAQVGSGQGDLHLDLAGSGLGEARYVRLVDVGNGPFNEELAGYDVDAVVNLSPPSPGKPDGGFDTGGDGSVDTGSDTGSDTEGDAAADGGGYYPGASGCGCEAAGGTGPTGLVGLIGRILS
jgi:hypothetical protein